jgi:hypothetical protein
MKNSLIVILLFINILTFGQKNKEYLVSFIDSTSGINLIGYKTTAGKITIKAQFSQTSTDTLTSMAIVLLHSEWLGIDKNGQVILKPFIYDNGPDYIEEGLFRFVENNKIGFANAEGKKIIAAKFDFVTPFSNGFSEYYLGGYRVYEKNQEHWFWKNYREKGYLNKSGQRFKKINKLKNNQWLAWTLDNKQVLLDKNGVVLKNKKASK